MKKTKKPKQIKQQGDDFVPLPSGLRAVIGITQLEYDKASQDWKQAELESLTACNRAKERMEWARRKQKLVEKVARCGDQELIELVQELLYEVFPGAPEYAQGLEDGDVPF